MQTKTGGVIILKLVKADTGSHQPITYKVVTEHFDGRKYNNPVLEGTFIEVEIMRNFRVRKQEKFLVEELDPQEKLTKEEPLG